MFFQNYAIAPAASLRRSVADRREVVFRLPVFSERFRGIFTRALVFGVFFIVHFSDLSFEWIGIMNNYWWFYIAENHFRARESRGDFYVSVTIWGVKPLFDIFIFVIRIFYFLVASPAP
jgi:hypothetical protein